MPCGDTEMLVRRLTECARSCLVLQSVTTPGRTQVGGCNQTERAAVFFLCFVLFETVGAFFFLYNFISVPFQVDIIQCVNCLRIAANCHFCTHFM